jgi:uncharacterized protein (DUF1015 family)
MFNLNSYISLTIKNIINENLNTKKMWGWYPNFKDRYYKDIDTAKNEIERIVSHENKQHSAIWGIEDPQEIINLYNYIETPKGVKIEPKIKQPIQKQPELEYLSDKWLAREQTDLYSEVHGIEIGRYMSGLKYIDTNDNRIYGTEKQEEQNIINIMKKIKNGDELPPILLDYDYGILDGHHRFEAAKRLKIKKIPVIIYMNPSET